MHEYKPLTDALGLTGTGLPDCPDCGQPMPACDPEELEMVESFYGQVPYDKYRSRMMVACANESCAWHGIEVNVLRAEILRRLPHEAGA